MKYIKYAISGTTLGLFLLLGPVCSSSGGAANELPSDKALVFFRLSCTPGELAWRSKTTDDLPSVTCNEAIRGKLFVLQVKPGSYQWLIFEDRKERIEWNRWTFKAPQAGNVYYWGDIEVQPSYSQLQYNESTIKEFKSKHDLPPGVKDVQRGLSNY